MIQVVDNAEIEKIKKIISNNFGNIVENDPFVYYIKYEEKHLKGILSYSFIYDRIELNYILVDEIYRRQGIGESLLLFLEQIAKEKKVYNISLEVECNNKPAISLYQKLGYQIVAKREKYYDGKDGYLMVKEVKK